MRIVPEDLQLPDIDLNYPFQRVEPHLVSSHPLLADWNEQKSVQHPIVQEPRFIMNYIPP